MIGACRSPHGERGLKCFVVPDENDSNSRSPHGERGLKSVDFILSTLAAWVALLTESVD